MGNVNRILFTDIEVERFVDGVLEITDIAKKEKQSTVLQQQNETF